MAPWLKQNGRDALIVLGASLVLQLAYLAEGPKDPGFAVPIVDAGPYHHTAVHFAQTGELSQTAFYQPPLFPLLLGLVYGVFGKSLFAARLLLALVGATSCLLLWSIGRRVFDARTGLIAGLLMAGYGPLIFFNARLLPPAPAILLNLLAMRLLIAAVDRPQWPRWLGFGLAAGLCTITVPNGAVLLVMAVLWLTVEALRRKRLTPAIVGIALAFIGSAVPIGAVTAYNYAKSGEWVIISYNGGVNFYVGNNYEADRTVAIRPGPRWAQLTRESVTAGARTPAAQNAYFTRRSLSYIRKQPGDFLRGLARKTARVCNAREIPRNVDVYVYRDFSRLLAALVWRLGPFAFQFGGARAHVFL